MTACLHYKESTLNSVNIFQSTLNRFQIVSPPAIHRRTAKHELTIPATARIADGCRREHIPSSIKRVVNHRRPILNQARPL